MNMHYAFCFLVLIALLIPVISAEEPLPLEGIGGMISSHEVAPDAIAGSDSEPDFLMYNETFAGYSILFPNKAIVKVSGDVNTTKETAFQTQSNVTILKVTVVPTDLTRQEIVNATLEKVETLPDYNLITSGEMMLDEETGSVLDYTWTDKTGGTSETKLVIMTKEGRAFIIANQFPASDFTTMAPVTDEMIESFRFIPVTVEKGYYYDPWYGWFWWPDTADWGVWNWDNYMQGTNDNWFSSSDYWGSGMDWIDVSNARWDWYMND